MKQGNNSRRSRGRGNGKRPQRNNNVDSHGPDVRVRGTVQQVHDKYLTLARDATSSGDRINAENYYQHAEHYYRIIAVQQENAEQRQENRDGSRDNMRGRRGRSGAEVGDVGDQNEQAANAKDSTEQSAKQDLTLLFLKKLLLMQKKRMRQRRKLRLNGSYQTQTVIADQRLDQPTA